MEEFLSEGEKEAVKFHTSVSFLNTSCENVWSQNLSGNKQRWHYLLLQQGKGASRNISSLTFKIRKHTIVLVPAQINISGSGHASTPIHSLIPRFDIKANLKTKTGLPSKNIKTLCLGMFCVSQWILPSSESVLSHTSGDGMLSPKKEVCFEKSLWWLRRVS